VKAKGSISNEGFKDINVFAPYCMNVGFCVGRIGKSRGLKMVIFCMHD
jgi:hypothetical protein